MKPTCSEGVMATVVFDLFYVDDNGIEHDVKLTPKFFKHYSRVQNKRRGQLLYDVCFKHWKENHPNWNIFTDGYPSISGHSVFFGSRSKNV